MPKFLRDLSLEMLISVMLIKKTCTQFPATLKYGGAVDAFKFKSSHLWEFLVDRDFKFDRIKERIE